MEIIHKLQPNRTIHLRGFDSLGAAAALHSATENSFKVSGVFRDPADFCVLTLWDNDNFFEHPSIKYLPDSNFDGIDLTFDAHYSGLRNLDSPRYPSIDWPYLDVAPMTGDPVSIRLFDHATKVGGDWLPASGAITIVDNGLKEYDRVTVWYLNFAFDYLVPKLEWSYAFTGAAGQTLTVDGVTYNGTGPDGAAVAQSLVDALAGSTKVVATRQGSQVDLESLVPSVHVSSTAGPTQTLHKVTDTTIAAELARQINALDWEHLAPDMPLSATSNGAVLTITAVKPGVDGNAITLYTHSKNDRLKASVPELRLTGGSSDATWRIHINFHDLGITDIRQMWLTFAPPIANGEAFESTEWEATFTNWAVTGPSALKVAGPGSVRFEERDAACAYTGTWTQESGFYSKAYARASANANASVTIRYYAASEHDLWLGTALYSNFGSFCIRLDNDAETELSTKLEVDAQVNTRRKIRSTLAPGFHTMTLKVKGDGIVYFDYLDAVVASDVLPDNLLARTNVSPALDYSTDHTFKLSPTRILWNLDKLGFAGPMNEYIGIFWWNQRKRVDAVIPQATVAFAGDFVDGDIVSLTLSGQSIWKTVFPGETPAVIARHFESFINSAFVGVWASATGNILTITSHSAAEAYRYTLTAQVTQAAGSTGAVSIAGSLQVGSPGKWIVDVDATPALNRAARDWHADLYSECAARNRTIVSAASMELVLPPDHLPARFPDGNPVKTDMFFHDLKSSHCAFSAPMLAFHKKVFECLASLQAAAGLTPEVQLGEFTWWYFKNASGMAFYDDETKDAAEEALERPLHEFLTPDDDPTVNGGADAAFIRDRLRAYAAALVAHIREQFPNAKTELLFPYDVNYPEVKGAGHLGGKLLRFINFPPEWEHKDTSGFDRLKMEGLDWGANTRDLNLVKDVIRFPIDLGWPLDSIRYMIPIYNGGCPWVQEYRLATSYRIPVLNFWAFDHIGIFGLPVGEPDRRSRSTRFR